MAQNKLDVIRKLLAKAEGAATPAEAEVYTAKAVELMARHGLDEALVNAKREVRETPTSKRIPMDGSYTKEKASLLGWLMAAVGGKSVHHNYGKKTLAVTLVGFATDIERIELLYTSLLLQALPQMNRLTKEDVDPLWGRWDVSNQQLAAFKRSWLIGFANTVHHRVQEAERKAAEQKTAEETPSTGQPGTALVLSDRRAQVEAFHAKLFPDLGSAKARKVDSAAYRRGAVAGRNANLGGTGVGTGARAALH